MSTLHVSTLVNREASLESRKASYESWKILPRNRRLLSGQWTVFVNIKHMGL